MAIKVTNREVDVETEILERLSEFGLSIDFGDEEKENSEKENKEDKNKKEANE